MKKTMGTAAALVAGVALALSGCGSQDSSGGSGGAGQEQAQEVKVGDTIPVKDLAQRISAATAEKKTAKMEMKSDSETVTGDLRTGDDPAFTMKGDMSDAPMEMIYVDKTLYLTGKDVSQMSGGKKWIKITENGSDMMSKMMGPIIGVFENLTDPGKLISEVDGDAKVTKVEGDNTTYEITLTPEQQKKLAEKLAPKSSTDPSASSSTSSSSGKAQTIELVVDKDDLPVSTKAASGENPMDMTYSDWGTDVNIEAPPASEVGTAQMPQMPSGSATSM